MSSFMKTMNQMVTKLTQTSPHVGFPTPNVEENYRRKISTKEQVRKSAVFICHHHSAGFRGES
jgi:hypothetical protein